MCILLRDALRKRTSLFQYHGTDLQGQVVYTVANETSGLARLTVARSAAKRHDFALYLGDTPILLAVAYAR